MSDGLRMELRERIDAIEESYEFMLAYAARGIPAHMGTGEEIRDYLRRFSAALEGLPDLLREVVRREHLQPAEEYLAFLDVLERDARSTQAVLRLALAQPGIGSQLVDNMNALIHARALLTDLFVIDELLEGQGASVEETSQE